MSIEKRSAFSQAVRQIASHQPELCPKPHPKPANVLHYELELCKAQRDELAEVLTYWLPATRPFHDQQNDAICRAHALRWDKARAAIAKAQS